MVMLALGEVPRCRRVHPELGAALEQHRHVLLREVKVCGVHLLLEAGALPGPLRVDHQLQPWACSFVDRAICISIPLFFVLDQSEARLPVIIHVSGDRLESA